MSDVACFVIEPTDRVRRALRCYASNADGSRNCPGPFGYHNAQNPFDEVRAIWKETDHGRALANCYSARTLDPALFPAACSCGYVFQDADERQVFIELVYQRADTGELYTLRDARAGAMWDAWWMRDSYRGPDGKCLHVMLPGGHEWCIDGPSSNGHGWTRTGVVPRITARPSIAIPDRTGGCRYHGFLTNGVLSPV